MAAKSYPAGRYVHAKKSRCSGGLVSLSYAGGRQAPTCPHCGGRMKKG